MPVGKEYSRRKQNTLVCAERVSRETQTVPPRDYLCPPPPYEPVEGKTTVRLYHLRHLRENIGGIHKSKPISPLLQSKEHHYRLRVHEPGGRQIDPSRGRVLLILNVPHCQQLWVPLGASS